MARQGVTFLASTRFSLAESENPKLTEAIARKIRGRMWWVWKPDYKELTHLQVGTALSWNLERAKAALSEQIPLDPPA